MADTIQLNYDDGYKTIELNGDPNKVIRINPTDTKLLSRLFNFSARADKIREKYKDIDIASISALENIDKNVPDFDVLKKAADNVDKLDMAIKELINDIFGYDISAIVFGAESCLSPAGGKPIYLNFMECIFGYIEQCAAAESKQSQAKLQQYAAQRDNLMGGA